MTPADKELIEKISELYSRPIHKTGVDAFILAEFIVLLNYITELEAQSDAALKLAKDAVKLLDVAPDTALFFNCDGDGYPKYVE